MFFKRIDLFRLFGIQIRLDPSWFLIALLITWSLAVGVFPQTQPGNAPATYWIMGFVGALFLFASILIHEFFHALVARAKGIPMRGITLFIFGGVAEMEAEPPSAKSEFQMAAAGPVATLVIAAFCYALAALGTPLWPRSVIVVIEYLATINLVLAVFNLVPAFPLDGGRILRAALWHMKGDLREATSIASRIGSGFGLLLIILGVFSILAGAVVGGMWWILIGFFIRTAATSSYQQVLLQQALQGEPVSKFMTRNVVTVPPTITIADLVSDYVYPYHHRMYPVAEDGQLAGYISTAEIKALPQEEWASRTIASAMKPLDAGKVVTPQTDALTALKYLRTSEQRQLAVIENGQLVGLITLRDLLDLLAIKLDLGA